MKEKKRSAVLLTTLRLPLEYSDVNTHINTYCTTLQAALYKQPAAWCLHFKGPREAKTEAELLTI